MEYEARLNYFLSSYEDAAICTYDVEKFGASVVVDVLDEFLKRLRSRKA